MSFSVSHRSQTCSMSLRFQVSSPPCNQRAWYTYATQPSSSHQPPQPRDTPLPVPAMRKDLESAGDYCINTRTSCLASPHMTSQRGLGQASTSAHGDRALVTTSGFVQSTSGFVQSTSGLTKSTSGLTKSTSGFNSHRTLTTRSLGGVCHCVGQALSTISKPVILPNSGYLL